MKSPLTNRQILTILGSVVAPLAVGSLLLGWFSGTALLRGMGLSGFAAMLAEIPVSSAIVGLVVMPLAFVVGTGLLWKGVCESRARSVVLGTIRSSTYHLIPTDGPDEYQLHSRVAYVVDGNPREAEGPHAMTCSSEAAAKGRVAELEPGSPVEVWYRPGEPGEIFLDAPPARTGTVLAVGAWITLSGCFAMFVTGVVFAG